MSISESICSTCFFFFQAEDGIRDLTVTGVQTCALPIFRAYGRRDVQGCADGIRNICPLAGREWSVSCTKIYRSRLKVCDSSAATNTLIIDLNVRIEFAEISGDRGKDRVGEGRTCTGD